jgi:hypothetical protein
MIVLCRASRSRPGFGTGRAGLSNVLSLYADNGRTFSILTPINQGGLVRIERKLPN